MISEPSRSLLSLAARSTTFSSRPVPVATSAITALAVFTLQLQCGEIGRPLCSAVQRPISRVDNDMQAVVSLYRPQIFTGLLQI